MSEEEIPELEYPKIIGGEDAMMAEVLSMFCEWVNQFVVETDHPDAMDAESMRIYPVDFSAEKREINGHEHGGYGYARIEHQVVLEDWEQQLWVVGAYSGDEGGPSLLTVWWKHETEAIYEPPFEQVEYKCEGDTYEEREATGRWVWKQDEEDPDDLSKEGHTAGETAPRPKYTRSEHLGWSLDAMVQEFDTNRSFVVENGKIVQSTQLQG